MKKILFALTILAYVLSALSQVSGADVSVDFIYNNLSGGNWIDVEGYGYGWQPDIAVSDPNWRPYSDGYWAYTDYGWTWISYEDFGWATYHYGRWARLADYGWVWIPGSDLDWGPAWVSWRTGGDSIGWAPLPPRGAEIVYEGQPIGATVDVEYDIGPEYYNFCDIRFIGEPVLRDRVFPIEPRWNRRLKPRTRRIFLRQRVRLHDQQAARQLLARAHPPRQGRGRQFRLGREANPGAYRPVRQQVQQAFRLRRLNEARLMAGQARNRAGQCRQDPARQLRHLKEASLMANQASNPERRFRRGQARQFRQLNESNLMANRGSNRVTRCRLEQARRLRHLSEANLMANRGSNRVTRCRLEQARRLRHLSEVNLMAGRRRSRAARCRLEQARRLRHLSEANLMAGRRRSRAARC